MWQRVPKVITGALIDKRQGLLRRHTLLPDDADGEFVFEIDAKYRRLRGRDHLKNTSGSVYPYAVSAASSESTSMSGTVGSMNVNALKGGPDAQRVGSGMGRRRSFWRQSGGEPVIGQLGRREAFAWFGFESDSCKYLLDGRWFTVGYT
ncbi:hypothetical protein NUW54_g7596 [Trametes sanguinea]|uniref:Uncharacterized protein n=1 Tax=Trametes sanguinea TaxID=158606 RepID=A0ACC1PJG3_9APHY|nr:hypothetical protein NUW54_g7596 [Trametes sanguinea]